MKALVKCKLERGLWLAGVTEPKIGIHDVLIRVDHTGICAWLWNWPLMLSRREK
jgi:threonine 3-dehydrogenase